MRVSGENDVQVAFAAIEKSDLQLLQQLIDSIERIASPKSNVGVDLVVAAARCVKFSSRIAQAINKCLFNVHVDVFQFRAEEHLTTFDRSLDFEQVCFDISSLFGRQKSLSAKHLSVCDRAAYVVRIQAVIETDALTERFEAFVSCCLKDATARRCSGQTDSPVRFDRKIRCLLKQCERTVPVGTLQVMIVSLLFRAVNSRRQRFA